MEDLLVKDLLIESPTTTHPRSQPHLIGVLGSQWGDEGKGALADRLAARHPHGVRFNGGSNAGHTVVVGEKKYALHCLPCSLINPDGIGVMANGMVISLDNLFEEIDALEAGGIKVENRLFISDRAHVVFRIHKKMDGVYSKRIGTTKQGIGPAYSDEARRIGLRMMDLLDNGWKTKLETLYSRYAHVEELEDLGDLLHEEIAAITEYLPRLRPMIQDTRRQLRELHQRSRTDPSITVVYEGANATMLDLQMGGYPFVTSSNTTFNGIFHGTGLSPLTLLSHWKLSVELIGVVKAYLTRVGEGYLITEQENEIGETLQRVGREVGVTSGRPRRCGWLDLVQLRFSTEINGFTCFNLTKSDILSEFETLQVCIGYQTPEGEVITDFPTDERKLHDWKPVYREMAGWKGFDFSSVKTEADLPLNFLAYLELIEEFTGVPVKYINTGPGRDQMIVREVKGQTSEE